ncbi:HAD family hydrolase [Shouchella sp. 1P09AA]|uniref:HAD family hydrolase n=1 Tax=unclassified Shouchella TaxID=2893065 RepID=UPI0039A28485
MTVNLFNNVDLVIFDLDGTLYEDTDHFDYYANTLAKELETSKQEQFFADYEKMKKGQHTVAIGKAYDVSRDVIVEVEPFNGHVEKVHRWNGEEVPQSEWKDMYQTPVTYDFDTLIAIGDGWWLPNVAARHYGIENPQPAYDATKEYMATENFSLTIIEGLREGLLALKEKKSIVLLTNSTEDDVERLLHLLDLEHVFHDVVTSARKPQHTVERFKEIMATYNVSTKRTLSIGDNYLNEIIPAQTLGMKAIYIDLEEGPMSFGDLKVRSISDLIEQMKEI